MRYQIQQTRTFVHWLDSLRDLKAVTAIYRRLERAEQGNLGDSKSLGNGISELRIDIGAGYRLYYTRRGTEIIILLAGGDKTTQSADIKQAIKLAREV